MENFAKSELEEFGLDCDRISLHQQRILSFLTDPTQNALPVKDTCRIENGGITPFEKIQSLAARLSGQNLLQGVTAFVPAAGAASRYFQPLVPLVEALNQTNRGLLTEALTELRRDGAEKWALPPSLKQTLTALDPTQNALQNRDVLLHEIGQAKALQPAIPTGESFLAIKSSEHQQLKGLDHQVFIVPSGQKEEFQEHFAKQSSPSRLASVFIEQGPKLSTIRFHPDGSPYRDENGRLSPVPAGHGTLVQLIPHVKEFIPTASTVFIRNIDNVMGCESEALAATTSFLVAHQWLFQQVQKLRQYIRDSQFTAGRSIAEEILATYGTPLASDQQLTLLLQKIDQEQHIYWQILINVFHCSPDLAAQTIKSTGSPLMALRKLMQRPVNSLGQVPNSGKDMGGTPVFTEAFATPLTICLEVPHASDADKKNFLSNPQKATHFNPVFVASEIVPATTYELENSPFWILARKTVGNTEVIYHETVLYELLGNSLMANVVFPEIPRLLFHPHKSLADSLLHN